MQLLPALLDSLRARRLSGAFGKRTGLENAQTDCFVEILVRHWGCLCRLQHYAHHVWSAAELTPKMLMRGMRTC